MDGPAFKERLKWIADQVESNFTRVLVNTMDTIQEVVIRATPVSPLDSGHAGRARNGWNVGINNKDTTLDMEGPFDPDGNERIEANRATLASIKPKQYNIKLSLHNEIPYMDFLNDGGSQQAPAGFVQMANLAAKNAVKNGKLLP